MADGRRTVLLCARTTKSSWFWRTSELQPQGVPIPVARPKVQAQLNGVNSVIKKHMSGNNMPAASDAAKETAEVSKPAANVEAAKPAAQKGAAAAKPEANAA